MGQNARRVFDEHYHTQIAVEKWRALLGRISEGHSP